MTRLTSGVLLMTMLAGGALAAAQQAAPGFERIMSISFDGNCDAVTAGTPVTVSGAENIKFAPGRVGQAGDFMEGGCLTYENLPAFDMQSGTIELWLNSGHDGRELADHYYLRFTNADESSGIEVKFYQVEMSIQVVMWGPRGKTSRYGWGWAKDAWQHIVICWDATNPSGAILGLYRNGTETGYPATYKAPDAPTLLKVGCQPEGGAASAWALLDEIAVYRGALNAGQVKLLYQSGDRPVEERAAVVRERVIADAAREAERTDLLFNHRKLAIIHGRHTSLLHWGDETFARLRLPVPDKIHEDALAQTDLSQYHTLFVPGGGGLRLSDAAAEALRAYIRQGGGYVGICGGAVTASDYGLIEATRYKFNVRGPVWNRLQEHPITEGYDLARMVLFPHASGPLYVIEPSQEDHVPVAIFDVGDPPLPVFVNTIARRMGKGRIVVFSGHPESSADTNLLLRNAFLWTTKILEPEEQ